MPENTACPVSRWIEAIISRVVKFTGSRALLQCLQGIVTSGRSQNCLLTFSVAVFFGLDPSVKRNSVECKALLQFPRVNPRRATTIDTVCMAKVRAYSRDFADVSARRAHGSFWCFCVHAVLAPLGQDEGVYTN